MNQHVPRPPRLSTQAAEGLPRWRWTLAEFDRFVDLGIIDADDKVELIGGELVQMSSKGIAHETVCDDLAEWLAAQLPKGIRLKTELGWRPDDETYCEPDILVFPRRLRPISKLLPADILLLIEVADSTLKKDTTTKAALYARLGVREYWVIDAFAHDTQVFREPTAAGYRRKRRVPKGKAVRPALLPDISLRLADLPFASEAPPSEA